MAIPTYLKHPAELAKLEEILRIVQVNESVWGILNAQPTNELGVAFFGLLSLVRGLRDEYDPGWDANLQSAADTAWKEYSRSDEFGILHLTDQHKQETDKRFLRELGITE